MLTRVMARGMIGSTSQSCDRDMQLGGDGTSQLLLAWIIRSLLAISALSWHRLPRLEMILNMLWTAVCLFAVWFVAEMALHIAG